MKYKVQKGYGKTIYVAVCYECNQVLEKVSSLAQKYCPDCKTIVDREKAKVRMRKYRERIKNGGFST